MREEYKRLIYNFFSLTSLQIANYLLPVITFPYLVRVLGVEKFGLISFALAFIAYFTIVVDYGFNITAVKDISLYRNNPERLSKIVSSVLFIKILLLFLSFLIVIGIVFKVEKFFLHYPLYLFTFGILIGKAIFPQWFFQGIERMEYITFLTFLIKTIFAIAIFIFIHQENDFYKVPLINAFGYILVGILALWVLRNRYHIKFYFHLPTIKYYLKYNFSFFISRIAVNLYTVSNTFILGMIYDAKIVGIYSVAEKVSKIVQSLYSILTQTLYPYLVKSKNLYLFKKILTFSTLINLFLLSLLAFFGELIFKEIFNTSNPEILKVFYILLIANLFILPTYLAGFPLFGSFGYEYYVNQSAILGAFFHLITLGILFLFGKMSLYSVAFTIVITELVVFLYRIGYAKKLRIL